MKLILTFPLLLVLSTSFAQSFYVDGSDDRSREHIKAKIKYEGYQLSDSSKADFIVQMLIDGSYKVFSLKQPYSGYLRILDNKTGAEVSRTKIIKRSPAALNGFNAAYSIFTTISKRYLADELKKCKKVSNG